MSSRPVPVILGNLGARDPFLSDEDIAKALAILEAHGVAKLDSSQAYGSSEERIGQTKAGAQFTIDTKWGVVASVSNRALSWATQDYIVSSAMQSIARLGVPQVDVFYLHYPDPNTPLAETLAGVDAVYRLGLFRRFGLSNFDADAVQAVHDTAQAHGFVLPTVFQGNYNPAARHAETELFPTLRRLGIAFYAYSPLAGGLLTKTADDIRAGKGRFAPGHLYTKLYAKPAILASLAAWQQAADEEGVSPAELAYRWVASNSILSREHGDAIIIGASSHAQLEETLSCMAKGGLSAKALSAIDDFWKSMESEAPRDPFDEL